MSSLLLNVLYDVKHLRVGCQFGLMFLFYLFHSIPNLTPNLKMIIDIHGDPHSHSYIHTCRVLIQTMQSVDLNPCIFCTDFDTVIHHVKIQKPNVLRLDIICYVFSKLRCVQLLLATAKDMLGLSFFAPASLTVNGSLSCQSVK